MKQNFIFLFLLFLLIQITIQNEELIVDILGTNDTHGAGIELNKVIDDLKYQIGGYKLLSGLINILRKNNPKGTLWLDAGDQFQGTLENSLTSGTLITDFFNTMKLDAATLGNHEWDWGKNRIFDLMNNATYKYVISNMKRKSAQDIQAYKAKLTDKDKIADLDKSLEDNVKNYQDKVQQTRVFSLHDGKIKIGVIGLTTVETYSSTSYAPYDYDISDKYTKRIMELSAQLRIKQGVHAVIVVSHAGMLCTPSNELDFRKYNIRKATDPEKDTISCNEKEIPVVLKKLPPYIIDGWVAGHVHETAHSFSPGFPIVQNPLGGKYVNVIRLKFQKITGGSYKVVTNQAEIQGPIPICSHVFVSTQRCESVPSNNKQIEQFKFKNEALTDNIDQKVTELFNSDKYKQVLKDIMIKRNHILFSVDRDFLNVKTDYNPLGALLAQAIKKNFIQKNPSLEANKVIAIFGYGTFRTEFAAGDVSEADMRTMFPFKESEAYSFQVTGDQLIQIVIRLQKGFRAFYCFDGLTMNVTKNPYSYVDGSARLNDGSEVKPTDNYTILTNSFNIKSPNGGDDFQAVFDDKILNLQTLNAIKLGPLLESFMDGFENKLYKIEDFLNKPYLKVINK